MTNYQIRTTAAYARLRKSIAPKQAIQDVREWSRFVDARERAGKTPESTAAHIARFRKVRSGVCACQGKGKRGRARDCVCLAVSTSAANANKRRPKATRAPRRRAKRSQAA